RHMCFSFTPPATFPIYTLSLHDALPIFTHSGVSIEESFTGTIMMVMIGLVSILPIAIVNKLFSEECRLHLSQLYATKVTRSQLYWTSIGLAVFAGFVGIL